MSQVRFFKLTTAARTAGTPPDSSYIWDEDEAALYRGDGVTVGGVLVAGGGGGGVSDHGALTGLADDDHTQYHNNTRGDARYSPLAHGHAALDTALQPSDIGTNPGQILGLDANGDLTLPGHLGLGTQAVSAATGIRSSYTFELTDPGVAVGLSARSFLAPLADSATAAIGIWGEARLSGAYEFTGALSAAGVYGEANNLTATGSAVSALVGCYGNGVGRSAGTVSFAAGFLGQVSNDDAVINSAAGVWAGGVTEFVGAAGSVQNAFGLGVDDVDGSADQVNAQVYLYDGKLEPAYVVLPSAPAGTYGILQESTHPNVLAGPLTVQGVAFSNKVDTTDPRLSDARTPTAHTHPVAQISDAGTVGAAVLQAATAAAAQQALDLEPGVDIQAYMPTASQAEMEAGTETALRAMSPRLMMQGISYHAAGVEFPLVPFLGQSFLRTDRGIVYRYTSGGWKPEIAYGSVGIRVNPAGDGNPFNTSPGGGATTINAALAEVPGVIVNGNLDIRCAYAVYSEEVFLPSVILSAGYYKLIRVEPTVILTTTSTTAGVDQNLANSVKANIPCNTTLTPSAHRGQWILDENGRRNLIWDNDTTTFYLAGDWDCGIREDPVFFRDNQPQPTPGNGQTLVIEDIAIQASKWTFKDNDWRIVGFGTTFQPQRDYARQLFFGQAKIETSWAIASGTATLTGCYHASPNSLWVRGNSALIFEACGERSGTTGLRVSEGSVVTVRSGSFQQVYSTAGSSIWVTENALLQGSASAAFGVDVFDPSMGGGASIKVDKGAGVVGFGTSNNRVSPFTPDATTMGWAS